MGVGDGRLILEMAGGVRIGRVRCAPVGLAGSGYDAVGAGLCISAVHRSGVVGKRQRSGSGEVGVAAVVGGDGKFVPVGTPMEDDGEHCERQEPHGS